MDPGGGECARLGDSVSKRRCWSWVSADCACSELQKWVKKPSRMRFEARIVERSASSSGPGGTPCRPMPVSTSRWMRVLVWARAAMCSSVQTTGMRLWARMSGTSSGRKPHMTRMSASRLASGERGADAGAFGGGGDAEPAGAGADEDGGAEFGSVTVGVGLDDGEDFGGVAGGGLERVVVAGEARRGDLDPVVHARAPQALSYDLLRGWLRR